MADCEKVEADGCKTGTSDGAYSFVGNILSGAALIAAGYNAYRAVELATKEWNMAKKYWQLAQNWLDYYKAYFAPVEDQELKEAMDLPHEAPQYDVARGRARVAVMMEFRDMLHKTMRCMSSYCSGLRQDMLVELITAQADSLALADGLGYRNERAYIETREDVRFEKMLNTAKRGRDIVADNVSFAKAAANIYGDLFNQTWAGLEGAGAYLGYWSNRNKTHYPTTYLRGASTQIAGQQRPLMAYSRSDGAQVEVYQGGAIPESRNIQERDL